MNRENIIRMAREAGAKDWQKINSDVEYLMSADALKEFAAFVAAAEREALLDLVDDYAKNNTDLKAAIRARGQA